MYSYLLARMAWRCRIFFFFSFLTPLRSLNGSQPNLVTYSLMTAMWKFGPNFPGHSPVTPRGQGVKTLFWNRLWTVTELIYTTEVDINNRNKTCQQGLPYMPPKFGGLFEFFRRIYGGKNWAADSASQIFFGWYSADKIRRLIRIFGSGLGV